MQLKTISFDGDLEEADREELVEAVRRFQKAQEENTAEFEAAKEQISDTLGDDAEFDDLLGEVEGFGEARSALIESITEFDSFEKSPLTREVLEESDFDELRDYETYFSDLDTEDEEEEEFNDMGSKAPTDSDDDDDDMKFARQHLGGMPGFQRSD